MGEAKRRGTFEQRKAQSVQKSGYFFTVGIDAELLEKAERWKQNLLKSLNLAEK